MNYNSIDSLLRISFRVTFDHKRQRRNILSVPEFDELNRLCIDLFLQGLVRVSNTPYVAPILMV